MEDNKNRFKIISQKYPDYAFIVVTSLSKSIKLEKTKYMIPIDMTVGFFLLNIRKKNSITLKKVGTIIMFANGKILMASDIIGNIYSKYKNVNDGILYVNISTENVFG
jgi:hypothetical protein